MRFQNNLLTYHLFPLLKSEVFWKRWKMVYNLCLVHIFPFLFDITSNLIYITEKHNKMFTVEYEYAFIVHLPKTYIHMQQNSIIALSVSSNYRKEYFQF